MRKQYFYIMSEAGCNTHCKVGISVEPAKRLEQVETGNHRVIVVRWELKPERLEARILEKLMLKAFRNYRQSGEWLSVGADTANACALAIIDSGMGGEVFGNYIEKSPVLPPVTEVMISALREQMYYAQR